MSISPTWGRSVATAALVAASAVACQSVLDIEEPKPLPNASAGGDSSSGSGGSEAGALGGGGMAGDPGRGGEGGEPVPVAGSGGAAGEGGSGITPECEEKAVRCAGESAKTPEVCVAGRWAQNTAEAPGDCGTSCDAGRCVECVGSVKRCSVCDEGDENCSQRVPQTCEDGKWASASQPCEHYCSGEGECGRPPSCAGAAPDCQGESCCLSLHVPGGEFKRNYSEAGEFNNPSFPAKISPFLLDKFEVTVSRMQRFVAAFNAIALQDGAGKAPHIKDDVGWSRSRNSLPADDVALQAALSSCGTDSTWAPKPSSQLPINCVDFHTAYAFCIWDGGRLPADAEWNFAAAGGAEQRLRAWKAPLSGPDIDSSFAVYGQAAPLSIGSKPKGNGRWGHADLIGNMGEYVLDFSSELSPEPCEDCVYLTPTDSRLLRGGTFDATEALMITTYADTVPLDGGASVIGFRCARDIE